MSRNDIRLGITLYRRNNLISGKVKEIIRVGIHTKFIIEWEDGTTTEEVALNLLKTKPGENPRAKGNNFFKSKI